MPDAVSRTLILMGCSLVLVACGQRGPLYLPQPQTPTTATSPAAAPGATSLGASGDVGEKKPAPTTKPQP